MCLWLSMYIVLLFLFALFYLHIRHFTFILDILDILDLVYHCLTLFNYSFSYLLILIALEVFYHV